MSFVVAPIVEGHGDVQAIRVLLGLLRPELLVARPVRFPKSKLMQDEHLIRAAKIAVANINDRGGLLLVIDSDEDCAAQLGPALEAIIHAAIPNRMCRVVLAVREFESWIVGGNRAYDLEDADIAGGLKERISHSIGNVYKETVDQPRLTAAIDVSLAERRSRSFRRLKKVVEEFAVEANS